MIYEEYGIKKRRLNNSRNIYAIKIYILGVIKK